MKRKAESSAVRRNSNKEATMDAIAKKIEEYWEFTGNSYDLVLCSSINRFFDDIGIKSISKSSSFINDVLREKFGYHGNNTIFCHKIKLTVLPEQFGSDKNTPEIINNKFWRGIKHRTNQGLNFFHYGAREKSYDPIKKYEQFKKDNTDDNNKNHQRQVLCVTPTRVTELNDYICEPLNNEMATYPPLLERKKIGGGWAGEIPGIESKIMTAKSFADLPDTIFCIIIEYLDWCEVARLDTALLNRNMRKSYLDALKLSPKSQNSYNIIQSLDEFYDDFVELYYPESTQNQQFNCLLI